VSTARDLRRLALELPGTSEEDHHGKPSFRVGGKIFATLWSDSTVNVMLDEGGIRTAVQALPGICSERWWGTRLTAVHIDLERIDSARLAELVTDAWEHKAPARLSRDS
jgi:hypothetical protein